MRGVKVMLWASQTCRRRVRFLSIFACAHGAAARDVPGYLQVEATIKFKISIAAFEVCTTASRAGYGNDMPHTAHTQSLGKGIGGGGF